MITDDRLFTCHEDCQTSFFRSLGTAKLADISAVATEPGKEYCVLVSWVGGGGESRPCSRGAASAHLGTRFPQEFSQDSQQPLPPWVIYLSCTSELDRFLSALSSGWKTIYQVPGRPGPRVVNGATVWGREPCMVQRLESGAWGQRRTSSSVHLRLQLIVEPRKRRS